MFVRRIKFACRGAKEIQIYSPEDFQIATGLTYLCDLEYQDEKTQERIRKQCADALKKGYIGSESRWLGAFHAADIRNHHMADVSIRWIDETLGYGLFSEKDIQPSEFIGEYTGVVRRQRLFGRENDYCFAYPTSAKYFVKHVIDDQDKGNEIRFINHSNTPNSEAMGVLCDGVLHIIVRAIQHIQSSAQITYDYSDFYWVGRSRVPNG